MAPRRRREDVIQGLKGGVAETLVEAIFPRAGYLVSRVGRESQLQRAVKIGGDEFLPDFLLRKPVDTSGSERPLHRLIPIEVKYRSHLEAFLRRYGDELLSRISTAGRRSRLGRPPSGTRSRHLWHDGAGVRGAGEADLPAALR